MQKMGLHAHTAHMNWYWDFKLKSTFGDVRKKTLIERPSNGFEGNKV